MTWRRPTTEPLHVRRGLAAGLFVGAAGVAGYLTRSPYPTPAGAVEMLVAVLVATLVVVALGERTNRELRRTRDDRG